MANQQHTVEIIDHKHTSLGHEVTVRTGEGRTIYVYFDLPAALARHPTLPAVMSADDVASYAASIKREIERQQAALALVEGYLSTR